MANPQNLRPFTSDQSREEAAKNGRKGGRASGVSKRKKKAFKDALLAVLESENKDGKNFQEIVAMGFVKRLTTGDPKAIKLMLQIIGEDPESDNGYEQREDDGLLEAFNAAASEVCVGLDDSYLLPEDDDDGEKESG